MHDVLLRIFALDEIFVCPHDAGDFCPCRKPKPGLLKEAAFKWHVNLEKSFVLSNKWQDAEMSLNAGCTSLLIDSPWIGTGHHDIVLANLAEAVGKIARLNLATLCGAAATSRENWNNLELRNLYVRLSLLVVV
jgi:D-glycero-D-manno-heptose 1,7-bisphosphate phosphatase